MDLQTKDQFVSLQFQPDMMYMDWTKVSIYCNTHMAPRYSTVDGQRLGTNSRTDPVVGG